MHIDFSLWIAIPFQSALQQTGKLFLDTGLCVIVFYANGACKASTCFLLKLLTLFCPGTNWEHTPILVWTILFSGKPWYQLHFFNTSGILAVAIYITFFSYICHGCALQCWHWCLLFLQIKLFLWAWKAFLKLIIYFIIITVDTIIHLCVPKDEPAGKKTGLAE